MQQFLLIFLFSLLSACASDSANQSPKAPIGAATQASLVNADKLKIGMSRADAEKLLGEPTSVTDTATSSVLVWVFDPGAAAAKTGSGNNTGVVTQVGGILATIAGIFNPIAGVATSVGSQVYNVSQNSSTVSSADTRSITIECKADKIVSIQRAHTPSLAGR